MQPYARAWSSWPGVRSATATSRSSSARRRTTPYWHVDDAVIKESWFERRVVPGLLTASLTAQIGSWLGWLATRMDFHFLRPVYTGDTITCTCTVTNKNDESRRIVCDVVYQNDEGTIVMRGISPGARDEAALRTRTEPADEPPRYRFVL